MIFKWVHEAAQEFPIVLVLVKLIDKDKCYGDKITCIILFIISRHKIRIRKNH